MSDFQLYRREAGAGLRMLSGARATQMEMTRLTAGRTTRVPDLGKRAMHSSCGWELQSCVALNTIYILY